MAPIAFTKNYTDHSNSQGYQFEFHCDKCGSGFRSSCVTSSMGLATGLLGAASNLFGGFLGQAASAGESLKDALRGQNWDHAFSTAVREIKPKFFQCTRCGKWVCPSVCWNAKASLCKGCAPDFAEESAAAQAPSTGSKFCGSCGKPMVAAPSACRTCKAEIPAAAKFCPDCGTPRSV